MFGQQASIRPNASVCAFYLKGQCKYGTQCWNLHQPNQGAAVGGMGTPFGANVFGAKTSTQADPKEFTEFMKQVAVEMSQWERNGQWLFSSFTPLKSHPLLAGFSDHSPEEMRFKAYDALKTNSSSAYQEQWSKLQQQYKQLRDALRGPTPDAYQAMKEVFYSKSGPDQQLSNSSQTGKSSGLFGKPAGSLFGGNSQQSTGLLGAKPQASVFGDGTSVFGGNQSSSQSMFGDSSKKTLFGGSATLGSQTTSTFGNQPNASPFGGGSTNLFKNGGGSVFGGAKMQGSIFGTSPSTTQTSGSLFGGSAAGNATAAAGSIFGGGTSANPVTSSTGSLFGGGTSTVSPATGNIFGGNSANAATPATVNSFGGNTNTVTSTPGSVFGGSQNQTSTIFGGSNSNNTQPFGSNNSTTTPAFGSSNPSAAPTFGSGNPSAAPTFGSSNPTTTPAFGSSNQNTNPTFGSWMGTATTSSVFGTSNTASNVFGPSSGTTTSGSVFGNKPSLFGGSQNQNQQSTSLFGNSASGAPSIFAGQPSTGEAQTQNASVFGGTLTGSGNTVPATGGTGLFGGSAAAGMQSGSIFGSTVDSSGSTGLFSKQADSQLTSQLITESQTVGGSRVPESVKAEWFTPLDQLDPRDKEQFEAEIFTTIPLCPPPIELCF